MRAKSACASGALGLSLNEHAAESQRSIDTRSAGPTSPMSLFTDVAQWRHLGRNEFVSEPILTAFLLLIFEFMREKCSKETFVGTQNRYMTANEAGEYLGGINARTMSRWAREGYIPAMPIGEGKRRLWRFLAEDLDAWMAGRRGQNAQ